MGHGCNLFDVIIALPPHPPTLIGKNKVTRDQDHSQQIHTDSDNVQIAGHKKASKIQLTAENYQK